MAHRDDELRHAGAGPVALVRLVDGSAGRERAFAIGEDRRERGLVRDQRPNLLRMARHEGERIHGATSAGEEVDRARAELGDEPMQVVGVLLRCRLASPIGLRAALDAPGVIGHHRAIGEMPGQRDESAGTHRRSDEEKGRGGRGIALADVIGQDGTRYVQGVRGRLGHRGHSVHPPLSCLCYPRA